MKKEQEKLLDELHEYAVAIRLDWADFDGRDLLWFVDDWIERFKKQSDLK